MMDAWDLSLEWSAEGHPMPWAVALRQPPGAGLWAIGWFVWGSNAANDNR